MDDVAPLDRPVCRLDNGLRVSTLLFVPNTVVVMRVSVEQFRRLHLEDRYYTHAFMTCAMAIIMVMRVLSAKIHATSKKVSARLDVMCILGAFAVLVVMYIMVGALWKSDPRHTAPIYPEFWYKTATPPWTTTSNSNSSTVQPSAWVCTMSEVVTRIEAFLLFVGPIVVAVTSCCGLCFWSAPVGA